MAETWLRCRKCRCEIQVPDEASGTIHCPNCGAVVLSVNPETGIKCRPPAAAPGWMKPAGIFCVLLGAVAFFASFAMDLRHTPELERGEIDSLLCAALSGLLNPLFFVGVPLGIYWLLQGRDSKSLRSEKTMAESEVNNQGTEESEKNKATRPGEKLNEVNWIWMEIIPGTALLLIIILFAVFLALH